MAKKKKKTQGKTHKESKFESYFDMAFRTVVDFFNQKYKIERKVEDFKRDTVNAMYKAKANVMKSVVETIMLSTGLLALIVGVLLIVANYFPLENVLIVYGLVITIVVLMRLKLRV